VLERQRFWATIPASDIDRAKAFYRDTLGLNPLVETAAWLTFRAGDGYFQLYPTRFAGTAQHTIGGWVVEDIASAVAELRGRGVVFEEYDGPGLRTVDGIADLEGVERAAWFRDSEGNILSISQFLVSATGE
jgi:catechol 2,3-dioxygenase-like lactoylglutathione lyase family enzyme